MERCAILACVYLQPFINLWRQLLCEWCWYSCKPSVWVWSDGCRGHGDKSTALGQCATSTGTHSECTQQHRVSCVIENVQNQNRSSFNTASLHAAFVCVSQNNKKKCDWIVLMIHHMVQYMMMQNMTFSD